MQTDNDFSTKSYIIIKKNMFECTTEANLWPLFSSVIYIEEKVKFISHHIISHMCKKNPFLKLKTI